MSYKEGILSAISALKERSGSSSIAIKKHMQASLPSGKKWMNTTFLTALKTLTTAGDLIQIKSSYKLSPEYKKKAADALKPKKPKKKVVPKKKSVPKKKKLFKKKSVPKKKKTTSKKKNASKKKSASSKKNSSTKKVTKKSAGKKSKTK